MSPSRRAGSSSPGRIPHIAFTGRRRSPPASAAFAWRGVLGGTVRLPVRVRLHTRALRRRRAVASPRWTAVTGKKPRLVDFNPKSD